MFLSNKKFIFGLILFLICFEIFFYSIPQINPVLAQSRRDEALVEGRQYNQPAPALDQGRIVQESGSASSDKVSGLPGMIVLAATVIMNLLGSFAGWIISIEAGILNWILNPDNIRMATAPIVVSGWDITRTTVNMFFVLVLLVVAFATILRIETYSLKAILPRLIIVAFLINFSLVIAGTVLDFANVMTKYFYTSATRDGSDIAMAIQNGLKLTNYYRTETTGGGFARAAGTLLGFTSASISVFVYALLAVLFCIAAIFIFLALIVMMLIRVLYIWVLLILAPAAWFFYIIPAWQSQWYKWWSHFFRWAFFAPIAMFFIFLSINAMTNLGKEQTLQGRTGTYKDFEMENLKAEAQKTTVGQPNTQSKNIVEAVFQSFIGMGLLLGSLMVANSMSITGAGMATSLGKKMGTGIAQWTGGRFKRSMTWGSRYDEKGQEVKKSYFERGLGMLAKAPVLGQLARPGFAALERQKADIQNRAKKYDGYSSDRLNAIFNRLSKEDQMAVNLIRMKRGEFNKLSDADKLKALNLAQKYGFSEEREKMLKLDPNLAFSLTKDSGAQTALLKEILTAMKADDWKEANQKMWTGANADKIIRATHDNLGPPKLGAMLQNINWEGLQAHQKYIKGLGRDAAEREMVYMGEHKATAVANAQYLRSAPGQKKLYKFLFVD